MSSNVSRIPLKWDKKERRGRKKGARRNRKGKNEKTGYRKGRKR